jgi:hypothetical protein
MLISRVNEKNQSTDQTKKIKKITKKAEPRKKLNEPIRKSLKNSVQLGFGLESKTKKKN